MPGRLEFDLGFGRSRRRREESEPMRLLVLGDFSGKPPAEREALASRPARRVDFDNVDAVMRQMAPRVTVNDREIRFEQIDDFHPDRLYARLDLFQALRDARLAPPAASDDDLSRLLGRANPTPPDPAVPPARGIDALIRDVVAPHIVKDTSARTAAHVAAVDSAIAHEMRTLLHAPELQSLEASWRGVKWLISGLELDENLELYLFDVSRDELLADIVAAEGKLAETGLYRALTARPRGAGGSAGWSAFVALFEFGPSETDIGLLAALGLIASHAGGPVLAGADLALADPAKEWAGWQSLRHSAAARWIGLAAPRVLLRLPYGADSDPIEAFAFEEFAGGSPTHEQFLWGNGSLALAMLIGRGFTARGWEMDPGDERDIGDLPAYTFVRDGEREMQACAERFLSDREIDTILKSGIVPIASRHDRNAVVAVRVQSVSDPSAPLAW